MTEAASTTIPGRDWRIDALKGLAIALMVAGHAIVVVNTTRLTAARALRGSVPTLG